MMRSRIYVIGSSALAFWRHAGHATETTEDAVIDPLSDCPTSQEELRAIAIHADCFGKAPLRLMVPSGNMRYSRAAYKYTVESKPLPAGAFLSASKQICVASPELCVIQAAKKLSIPRLLELCMELCGTYALMKESARGFITRNHQLMTVSSLKDFLNRCNSASLNRKLAPWLAYIAEGSHSPMETREHLLMSLPKRIGGYGMPPAVLNMRVDLNDHESALSSRGFFLCDMCWPEQKVVVEYDGQSDHASAKDRADDATRQNILVSRGYAVFVITAKQIYDAREFDSIVKDIAHHLGFRLKSFPDDWAFRRDNLRNELFKSAAAHNATHHTQENALQRNACEPDWLR